MEGAGGIFNKIAFLKMRDGGCENNPLRPHNTNSDNGGEGFCFIRKLVL